VAARLSEYQGTFSVTEDLYCFEGNRVTCAGLCAILDMMLHLVGRLHGDSVAKAICQDLIYSNPRPAETPQRLSPGLTSTPNDPRIVKCLARIEASPATPVPIAVLADMLGLSQRHLQKLAQRELGISLADYSLFHRLSKARDLALQTNMTMLEIAVATGLSSASVFARAFKNRYGQSASTYRNTYRQARARPFAVNSRLESPGGPAVRVGRSSSHIQASADLVGQCQPAARALATMGDGSGQRLLLQRSQPLDRQHGCSIQLLGDFHETICSRPTPETRRSFALHEFIPGELRVPAEAGKGQIAQFDGGGIVGGFAPYR
jgi:AraC-like DNA-binding protein